MTRIIAILLVCLLVDGEALAVGWKKAVYVGGTIQSLNQRKEASDGRLDLRDGQLVFNVNGQSVGVPYDRITELEYQHSSRFRPSAIGGAIGATGVLLMASMVTIFFFPVALAAIPLAKKKRKRHFLTVGFTDADDKPQVMVLELGKNIEREARIVIAARSGKEIKIITERN